MNNVSMMGRSVVLFVLAMTVAVGQTPASFTGPRAYLGNDAAIADFNGDGILDLATIDQVTNAVHFHSGLGNGTFAHDATVLTTITSSRNMHLATGDLNGDGLPDLVVGLQTSTGSYESQVLLGKAGGGFVREPVLKSRVQFSNLYLADLNGDGHIDLIVVGGYEVGVLLGRGDGTFQPETTAFYSQQLQPAGLAIADFNGDGIPDFAVPVLNGIFILFGDGTGKFPTGTTFTTTEQFGPIAAADLNGDGKQDLVVEYNQKGLIEVLLGDDNGAFGEPQVYFIGEGIASANGLALGDINGDGILDIVTPDPAVLIGKGDGTFANPVLLPANEYWQSLQLVDLRGIGQLDVVANVANGDDTIVLLNEGLGTLQEGLALRLAAFPTNCLAVADFNRDGHDDVAVGVQSGVDVYRGTGQPKALVPSLSLTTRGGCPLSGDFNNDGIPDLLVEGYGNLNYFAGVGDGTFASPVLTPVLLKEAAIGDFNGDGTLDVAGIVSPNIQALTGNGSGGFTHFATIPEPSGARSIVAADLNGDGLTDLVVLRAGPSQVTAYLNQGSGSFTSSTFPLPASLFGPNSALIADVNKDGIPDLVVIGTPNTYIFLGQGAGVFSQVSEVAASGMSGAIADLNGDGFPDLVLVDGFATKVFLGNGTGTFTFPGNPDGLWFGTAVPTAVAPAFLQSQSPSSGLADLITVGQFTGFTYVGVLLNQALLK